jgi:hypothetical protein
MYLALSEFTSSPFSLQATIKAPVLFVTVCTVPPNILSSAHIKNDVHHLIQAILLYQNPLNGIL